MTEAPEPIPLAVIGGGIVGCALALALDHAGVPVVLLDRGPTPGPESDPRRGWPSRRTCWLFSMAWGLRCRAPPMRT